MVGSKYMYFQTIFQIDLYGSTPIAKPISVNENLAEINSYYCQHTKMIFNCTCIFKEKALFGYMNFR